MLNSDLNIEKNAKFQCQPQCSALKAVYKNEGAFLLHKSAAMKSLYAPNMMLTWRSNLAGTHYN